MEIMTHNSSAKYFYCTGPFHSFLQFLELQLNWFELEKKKTLTFTLPLDKTEPCLQTLWHGMIIVKVKWQKRRAAKSLNECIAYKNRTGNQNKSLSSLRRSQTSLYRAWPWVRDVFVVPLKRWPFKDVFNSFHWVDAHCCGVPVREMKFKS